MSGTSQQPSNVTESDKPKEQPANIVTDETEVVQGQDAAAASDDGKKADDDSAQTTDDSATSGPKKPKQSRRARQMERRLNKLNADLAEERAAREQDQTKISELESQVEELSGKVPKPVKPKITDFDDPEEFAEKYAEWKQATAEPAKKPAKKKAASKRKPDDPATAAPIASDEDLKKFHTAGVEALGDSFLAAQDDEEMAINQVMGEYILGSDAGHDLFVYFSENHDDMREVFDESPVEAVKLMQEIESELKSGKRKPKSGSGGKTGGQDDDDDGGDKPQRDPKTGRYLRKQTGAPPPGPDNDTGTAVPAKDLGDADMDDYAASRRAQIQKGRYRM